MIYILLILFLLWSVSILVNLIYYFGRLDTDEDRIFVEGEYSYENVKNRLSLLEKNINRNLAGAYQKLDFYYNNSLKTRRKFSYFAKHIEPSFIKIYLKNKGGSFMNSWKTLDFPVRMHFFFLLVIVILIALFGLIILIIASFDNPINIAFIFTLFVFVLMVYRFFFVMNVFIFHILVDGILAIFKRNRAGLNRNITILKVIVKGGGVAVGGYSIAGMGTSDYSGSDFGGFGGGSFGGGGAGGSW